MGGTMKDVNGILPKINAGTYKLANRQKGKSEIWNLFAEIKKSDGSLVHGFLCCRKCMSLHKFDGKRTSNLNRHRCYKMLMNNGGKVKRFFEMMEGSPENHVTRNPLSFMKVLDDAENQKEDDDNTEYCEDMADCNDRDGGEDTKRGNDTEYGNDTYEENEDDIEDSLENTTEDIKVCNPLDLMPQLDDSQHYEATTFKLKKSHSSYITPTRVQRNMKQLNSLCEMIKSDLHDAPDDLFFVAKWKIMDILRDVQSKRLDRQDTDSRGNKPSGSKDV